VAMTSTDTVDTMKAEVSAAVSGGGFTMGPSAEVSTTSSKNNKEQKIEFTCKALGGDVTIWGKFAETQEE